MVPFCHVGCNSMSVFTPLTTSSHGLIPRVFKPQPLRNLLGLPPHFWATRSPPCSAHEDTGCFTEPREAGLAVRLWQNTEICFLEWRPLPQAPRGCGQVRPQENYVRGHVELQCGSLEEEGLFMMFWMNNSHAWTTERNGNRSGSPPLTFSRKHYEVNIIVKIVINSLRVWTVSILLA